MLRTLTLRLLHLESRQGPYLSVAVSPAISRQKATRARVTLNLTAGLSQEHCLGSAGPANFHQSADKPLKELRRPLSEYGSERYPSEHPGLALSEIPDELARAHLAPPILHTIMAAM